MVDSEAVAVDATLELDPEMLAPRQARQFITEFCTAAGLDESLCQTAALLASELVTNAILHGRTRCILSVKRPPPQLRVSVADDNPDLPAVGPSPEPTATSGRGMTIVATLAPRWGIERTATGGKAVWFELDPPEPPRSRCDTPDRRTGSRAGGAN